VLRLTCHPGAGPASASGRGRLPGRGRAIVAALSVTQTVGYGCLWYSFPVLLEPVAAELGASRTQVTGAFTTAVLAAAALAVPVGRWLDRHGSRALMTTGSVLGSVLLVALSRVNGLVALYAIWAGIGAVGAMVFYEAAFATVIAWSPPGRRATALLTVTVVAGFASTIFLPLVGYLVSSYGWRAAAVVLAAVNATVTVPLHGLVLRPAPRLGDRHASAPDPKAREAQRRQALAAATRNVRYWLLGLAFTAQSLALAAMTVHLIGFLVAAGHPPTLAATVAGALGALSVSGRLLLTGLSQRWPLGAIVAGVFAVQAVAAAALPLVAGSTPGAIAGYASLSGRLAVPITIAVAGAPLATAAAQQAARSYTPVLLIVAASNMLAAVAVSLATRPAAPTPLAEVAVRQ
jgi:MFS family permease